jgi:ferrochelatase
VIAVVVMAHGAPRDIDDIEAYYTDIRGGRPPTPELLAELVRRYEAIGGRSPLAERTSAQRDAMQKALDAVAPNTFEVVVAFKHSAPRIEDTIGALGVRGIDRAIGIVMAPHWSPASVGTYHDRAHIAATGIGIDYAAVERWHLEPSYLAFLADAVKGGLAALPARSKVVFTAHSLPLHAVTGLDDPYPVALHETAVAVATRAGLTPWASSCVAFQSAGRTSEPWLGPDLRTVITDLAAADGATGVLVCPCGFVADNLELLYDLDLDLLRYAESLGLALARTPAVNDDATVMAGLAQLVVDRAGRSDGGGR